ncbi:MULTISPECIES: hypothetical protein [Escherichia]|uniref:hypothetical protein n=2 Tax=Escherichia TaxID=561 RepID=UPI001CC0AC55|nr:MULTISPECIES: hypothetical protein [Escherichia]MED9053047.1 hypothetical protein [Escherichia marmotae]MCC4040035.1 hypothetical protein [Escherichia coli]MCQ6907301.1 hypothetical protein [Escherichia coli]MCQ6926958.1 hypothetical protein [Escherichia coli]MCZ9071112.1 hypothetical protein [Escherichia albertii]
MGEIAVVCGAIAADGISPLMKAYIKSSEDMVVGYIGEGSSAELMSVWQPSLENVAIGGIFGKLADTAQLITGHTTKSRLNATLVWEGQQPPEFTLVLDFLAMSNAKTEVNDAITTLLKMASPELNDITPFGRVPEAVTINIGRNVMLTNVVIKSVSYQLDAPRTPEGYFTHNTVTLLCSGNTSLNRSNISSVFV